MLGNAWPKSADDCQHIIILELILDDTHKERPSIRVCGAFTDLSGYLESSETKTMVDVSIMLTQTETQAFDKYTSWMSSF